MAARKARRGLLATATAPRTVTQTLARDEFGEVAGLKREALHAAVDRVHQMRPWHRRKNDASGRWNSFCYDCNALAVVQTDPPRAYGSAFDTECATGGGR